MSYSLIDPQIDSWASANSLEMYTRFAGMERRFCYIFSESGECSQISIQQPENEKVKVDVWSVETWDDREFHEEWTTSLPELSSALNSALLAARRLLNIDNEKEKNKGSKQD